MPGDIVYIQAPRVGETLKHGQAVIAVGGTAVPLAADPTPCQGVSIQVMPGNASNVWVGGAAITSNGATGGNVLVPAAGAQPPTLWLSANDLSSVYINSAVLGQGVNFMYW